MTRLRGVNPLVWDGLLALALAVAGSIEVHLSSNPSLALRAGVLVIAGTVALRRTHPLGL